MPDQPEDLASSRAVVQTPPTELPLSDGLAELPSYSTRALTYLILLILAVFIAWASSSDIDIYVNAPATMVPEGRRVDGQVARGGILRQILVHEGDYGRAGQLLAVIEADRPDRPVVEHSNLADASSDTPPPGGVTAPIDGYVVQRHAAHSGLHVFRDQIIMSLLPDGVNLSVELRIRNKDRGMVHIGDQVRVKFEAFPHMEFGAILGLLNKIMPNADPSDGTYRAFVSLDQTYFRVNGRKVDIVAGMTADAKIVTGRKTILALMLEPIQTLRKTTEARK